MDINTLLETLKDALSQDVESAAWATTTYGKTHKVFIGINLDDPPAEADCPYFALMPVSKFAGSSSGRKRHGFQMVSVINDSTMATNDETNVTEFNGVKRIETFRKLGEDAISSADISGAKIDTVEIDYDTIDSFPFMLASTNFDIGQEHLLSSDPLE